MDERVERFLNELKGKKIAVVGIGVSNAPVCAMLKKLGADVLACDKKNIDELREFGVVLKENNIPLKCGDDYMDDLDVDVIIRAPGIYYNDEKLTAYRKNGVVVTSEMELFFDLCPCKVYAVTGSDGKTTTTSVIAEMLKKAGKKVFLGGNIGKALFPLVTEISPDDRAVVELSSFQLLSMRESPDVAVVTNVSPNHLNVHGTMEEYVGAKLNIINHQNAFSKTVLNADNDITKTMFDLVRGRLCTFSRLHEVDDGAYCDANRDIYLADKASRRFVMNAKDIKLPGDHNIENYLTAMSAVSDEVSPEDMAAVAREFGGVEHRIEFVRELDGVKYYNDSIASTPTRTIAGLKAFGKRIIIIAGGYDKHIPYEPLAPYVNKYVKTLILLGATADKIEAAVKSSDEYDPEKTKIIRVEDLEEAVKAARENAVSGDVVSMSPASASFDKYRNFEERGRHFKSIVNGL